MQKLNHNVAKAAAAGSLCSAPSTCKSSGQLAPPARQRAACRAYSLRRLDEEEDGGLDELSGELRRNRGAGAAEDDQVHHGARAQRTSSSFPDSFSHLMIMAASLTSSSTLLTGQPLGGEKGGWMSTLYAAKKIGKKSYLGKSSIAVMMGVLFVAPAPAFVPNLRPSFRYLSQLCTGGLKSHPMTISGPVWVLWHPSTHPDLKTRMNLLHTDQGDLWLGQPVPNSVANEQLVGKGRHVLLATGWLRMSHAAADRVLPLTD